MEREAVGGHVRKLGPLEKFFVSRIARKGFTISRSTQAIELANRDYSASVGDGLHSDVIMSPVLWAAARMAESPIGVHRLEDEEIDFEHDIAQLLKRPNGFYSGSAMRKAATISYLTDGNAYLLKVRNNQLKPIELWYVPHWLMEPHSPADGSAFLDYYEYFVPGQGTLKVDPADVLHFRDGMDPANPRKGLSRLKILLREIYTDDEAAMFSAMLLKNGAVPGVIISPEESGTVIDDPERTKKKILEEFGGAKRGSPMVMSAPTKVQQLGWDPKSLDLSALREIPEERVTACLGIPAAVVGFGTGLQQTKVGATMAEMRAMAYEDCIIPMQNGWADDMDLQLLPDFEESPEQWRIAFDLSGVRVLRDDETKLSDRVLRQFQGGLITRMVALDRLGYESTPDDDVLHLSMATVIVPKAQAGAAYAAAQEEAEPAPQPKPAESAPGETDPDDEKKGAPLPQVKVRMDPKLARLVRRMKLAEQRLGLRFQAHLENVFAGIGRQAAQLFEAGAQARGLKAEPDEYWIAAQRMAEDIVDAIDYSRFTYAEHYLSVAKDVVDGLQATLGLDVMLSDQMEMRVLHLAGTRKGLVDLPGQTKDALFKAVAEGRELGEGAAELARRIADYVSAGPWASKETRAMVIARTETKYAQNASSLSAYLQSENVTGVMIFDAQLGPTDEECEQLNGQVVNFAEAERLMETEHPNGTRSFAPVVG